MVEGFQSGAFDPGAFQILFADVTAFDPGAFQTNAFQIFVAPPPPPPTSLLPVEVNIDGGWTNTGHRIEIVDGPTPSQVQKYLDDLWEDKEDEYESVEPDFVFGQGEYAREKTRNTARDARPAPPPRVRWSFDPRIDETSRKRAVMLVIDAKMHDLPVQNADAFPLRYRLGLFPRSYESQMLGGTIVRLVPSDQSEILHLARLARLHRYRLVIWSHQSLFLFDKLTLRPKISGAIWMALGAGLSLWLGHDLRLASSARRPQAPTTKKRRAKKRR